MFPAWQCSACRGVYCGACACPCEYKDVSGPNKDLQALFRHHFKPLGIVAYTACCRLGCTATYDEEDEDVWRRPQGIVFFLLTLDGMNYRQIKKDVYAQYFDSEYLLAFALNLILP